MSDQLRQLRDRINDLGQELDAYRTKTAAALGGGVFVLLLAAGAGYDLLDDRSAVWAAYGITRDALYWITGGLAAAGLALCALALSRNRRRDHAREAQLARLEQEYERLLEEVGRKT